jgi:hypothetical protein
MVGQYDWRDSSSAKRLKLPPKSLLRSQNKLHLPALLWRSDWMIFDFNGFAKEILNAIFNLAGTRLYPLVAYLGFVRFLENHPESP